MRKIIGLALGLSLLAAHPASGETLYGADGAQGKLSNLYILNPANGASLQTVGPIGFAVTGLAVHPTTGVMYGSTGNASGPPNPRSLITINKSTGQGTLVGPFNAVGGGTMADLTFTSDGTLYGWGSFDDLYTINLTTGAATSIGPSNLPVFTVGGGLAADVCDTLYLAASTDLGPLRTVDRTTGTLTTVAALDGSTGEPISAMAFNGAGALFGSLLLSDATSFLITIDKSTGHVTVLGQTVDLLDAIAFDGVAPGSCVSLVAAVLPTSRSVQVGSPATAFVAIINAGTAMANSVGISLQTLIPATFSYQTTNPATNQPTGTPDTPATIPPGQLQTYVIAVTPTDPIEPTDVALNYTGTNTAPVAVLTGINTLLLSGSATPTPDIVALAASGDPGIVDIPGATGTGAFAVATVNVGASALITAMADTGGVSLPVSIFLCQTNPSTAQCITPLGTSVTAQINTGETPTFSIFVAGSGTVDFNPATNRIFVRFQDVGLVTRGSTSVAVRTQ